MPLTLLLSILTLAAPANDQEAQTILARAATAQYAGTPPSIDDFYGTFQFKYFEYDEGKATPKMVGDARYYWLRRKTGTKEEIGFRRVLEIDGKKEAQDFRVDFDGTCWKPSGRVGVPLAGKEYEKDREELLAQRRRMSQLLDLFFLRDILDTKPQATLEKKGEPVAFHLADKDFAFPSTARIAMTVEGGHKVTVWIADGTHHLVKARIDWKNEPGRADSYNQPIEFVLAGHLRAKGHVPVLVPTRIGYLVDGRTTIEITTASAEQFHFNAISPKNRKRFFVLPE